MADPTALHFGPFRLMGRHGPLLRDGREVKLQPKTLAALWTLVRQAGTVVTKLDLMDAVWPGVVVGEDALSFQIQALRRALEDDPRAPRYVLTVHRIGFRFAATVTAAPALAVEADPSWPAQDFVGRQPELAQLQAALDQATGGRRQTVFVSGEAGIGKTRLVNEFLAQAPTRCPGLLIGRGQCVEHRGGAEAYLPLLDALGDLLRQAVDERPLELLRRLAPGWLLQLPALVPPAERLVLQRQARGASPVRMLRELAEALEQIGALHPVVLVLEDLHWSDSASLDLLALLARRTHAARLLVLATYRPVDAILAEHPVRELLLRLKAGQQAREHLLGYLDAGAVAQYLRQRLGQRADDPGQLQGLLARCGGHPLFMVQILDYLIPPGHSATPERARLESELPRGLRDLVALQMSQLGLGEQLVLEVASVVGREFAAASVAAGAGLPVDAVERTCDQLARRGQFIEDQGLAVWPDGTSSGRYRFRHVVYEQVLRQAIATARRARLHRQIADRLVQAFGARDREIAGELANHYEQAGAAAPTVRYCIVLAGIALERAAGHELHAQTERGLGWQAARPAGPERDQDELALRTLVVAALQARLGNHAAAIREPLERVEHLVRTVREPALLEQALAALWRAAHFSGEYERALGHARRIGALGRELAVPELECCGHAWSSHSLNIVGRHVEADVEARLGMAQAEAALRLRPQLLAVEPGAAAMGAHAVASWYLGFADRAVQAAHQANASVARIGNPYAECLVRAAVLGNILLLRQEWAELLRYSLETFELCERHGHEDGQLLATQQRLIARCMLGEGEAALDPLLDMLDRDRDSGCMSRNLIAGYVMAAEAAVQAGQLDRAERVNDGALELIRTHGPRAYEPEIWRLRATLLLAREPTRTPDAEAALQRALDLSRQRQARSLELRAALALVRWRMAQERPAEALALLRPVYGQFTEGHATPDLVQAAELMRRLVNAAH